MQSRTGEFVSFSTRSRTGRAQVGLYGGWAMVGWTVRLANIDGVRFCGCGEQLVEGFAPEHLALEDAAEVAGGGVERRLHGGLAAGVGLELEAGDLTVVDAAGDDPFEVAEVGGDVERESVGGDALGDVDADGRDLLLADTASGDGPDAGELADALGHDAEVAAGADQSLFEETDVVDGAKVWAFFAGKIAAEIEDGVADELAGAVIGDVAAAIDLVHLHSTLGEEIVASEDVGAVGVAAEGEDGRMLQHEESVADEVLLASGDDLLLDGESFAVGDAAEMEKIDVHERVVAERKSRAFRPGCDLRFAGR
jgi:hypothetical protein